MFTGGADLDAIETVCGPGLPRPVLGLLHGLADKSLVRPVPDAARPRFQLLETVCGYAAERLGVSGAEDAVDRHASCYTSLAERIAILKEGPEGEMWLARARTDADNLRAAIDAHTAAGRHALALQMVADLCALWWDGGLLAEGRERLLAVLDQAPLDAPARPMAHALLGWLGLAGATAEEQARRAVALAREGGDAQTEAFALQTLGTLLLSSDRHAAPVLAVPVLEEAIRVARRGGGHPVRYAHAAPGAVIGGAAHDLCIATMWRDLAAAERWAQEALSWAERAGYPPLIAADRAALGAIARLRGDLPTAERLLTAADAIFGSADTPVYQVWCLYGLADSLTPAATSRRPSAAGGKFSRWRGSHEPGGASRLRRASRRAHRSW